MNPPQKQMQRTYYRKSTYNKYPMKKQPSLDERIKAAVAVEMKKKEKKVESKMFDRVISADAIDFTGLTYNLLLNIAQGAADNQYIGSTIKPTTLRMKWDCTFPDTTNMLRVIVLQTIGGGTPTTATVLQSVGNVRAPLSPFERDWMKTFKVLYDEMFTSVLGTQTQRISGDVRIPYTKLREVEFTDSSGSLEANGIFLIVVSDSAAASHPVFQAQSRIYYRDC